MQNAAHFIDDLKGEHHEKEPESLTKIKEKPAEKPTKQKPKQ